MTVHTDHAVVIGASIGGLLAARALSESFTQVTVMERDVLPAGAVQRQGVPQARHAHGLLARGREALDELFGGLTQELVNLGAPLGDAQANVRWINGGRSMRQAPSGMFGLGVSRLLLEDRVRARVVALPNVRILDGCDVVGPTATADGRRVTGLRVMHRAQGSAEETLDADLVVDASGRGSRSPVWLTELGHPAPRQDEIRIGMTYVSRAYRRAAGIPFGVVVAGTVANPRGGVMLPQEDDRWLVSLGGMLGEAPPLDHAGYTAYAQMLPSPAIHEVIRDAEPLGDAVRFRYPATIRRRYEDLRSVPDGYLVFGDAICSFNPFYGQGMTVAAVEALELRRCLAAGTDRLARRFFRAAARFVDVVWDISVGGDLRFPEVEGPRTRKVRIVNAYLNRLYIAAEHDPEVGRRFLRVVNLLDRPERLLSPGTVHRVLRGSAARSVRPPLPGLPVPR